MPTLSPSQLITVARQAGFSPTKKVNGIPQDVLAVSIAMAESGGNTHAHNTRPPDNSYGPWQINMYAGLGPARRRKFGLKSNNDLFDPNVNAKAAYAISSNGTNFTPWSTFKFGKHIQYLPAAKAAASTGGSAAPGGKKLCPAEWTKSKTVPAATDKKIPEKPSPSVSGAAMITFPAEDDGDQWYKTAKGCHYLWKKKDKQRIYWGNEEIKAPSGPGDVSLAPLLDALGISDLLKFLEEQALRVALFVGGGVLLVVAILMVAKQQGALNKVANAIPAGKALKRAI